MKIKVILLSGIEDSEKRVAAAFEEAKKHRADMIEISYGTHAGELKRRMLNFLAKKEYRDLYSRLVKSKEGWGRIFIHFRWK